MIYLPDDSIERNSIELRMGQMITIPGIGSMTLGHPSAGGGAFFTAAHRTLPQETRVLRESGGTPIGVTNRSAFNMTADFVEVVVNPDVRVSSFIPIGVTIRDYRGFARSGDRVISIRGMSGGRIINVYEPFFTSVNGGLVNKLLAYPNDVSQAGDSGAALIRTTDNSVIAVFVSVRNFCYAL